MRMVDVIKKKRDGGVLSKEEISFWIKGYVDGSITDYQSSAMTMAIYFQGMTDEEMTNLTMEMAASGDSVELEGIEGIKVDKHSTGGVGDKTSLVVGPIVAACGCRLAKMSGRGLGHTGGTLDKLESIKGFHTEISNEAFRENINRFGLAIVGQSGNLVPADKKLYALRDVTATVDSMPLIAASIMSKKLAAKTDCILLDVKTGNGAFMQTLEDSIALAEKMVAIGNKAGRKTAALITDMNTPLGDAVGNAIEVEEAIHTLKGHGPEDFTMICKALASNILFLAGQGTLEECKKKAQDALASGAAYEKFVELIKAQGGDVSMVEDTKKLPQAKLSIEVKAPKSGYVVRTDTQMIGIAACELGAGRARKEDVIDPAAGILLKKKYGDSVKEGETIAILYADKEALLRSGQEVFEKAYEYGDTAPEERKLVAARVAKDGVEIYGEVVF